MRNTSWLCNNTRTHSRKTLITSLCTNGISKKRRLCFVTLYSCEPFVEWLKHDDTVRFRSRRSEGKKTQINLWRGGDFKERIKPLIVRPAFRWNSSRWLERISEKLRVRAKSRFHLQRAVAMQPDAVTKKSIDRPTDRSLVQGFAIGPSLSSWTALSLSDNRITRKNHLSAVTREENRSDCAMLRAIRNAWITKEQE